VRTVPAFVAGLVLGAAGAGLVAVRFRHVLPESPPAPQSAAPASLPTASSPLATFPAAPSPSGPALGAPEAGPSTPPAEASPWVPSAEAEALLGTHAPSPVPGDSTDALMSAKTLAVPADVPAMPSVSDLDRLRSRALLLPVQGYDLSQLRDNFSEKRGARVHEAIDMAAPRGTPVLAVDDGVVKKLFASAPGGLTVYQFDPTSTYSYYYAHLDRYAEGLHEGEVVRKGDRLGYVGTSGNAPPETPHLHFTVFKLAPTKRWWEGTPINPYPLWALRR
jgi:peptidoglycan LD-endopeptidase LytH